MESFDFERSVAKRDFTRSNFRTRVVCDVVCDLVVRDVLGAPRAEGKWYNGDMKLGVIFPCNIHSPLRISKF